METSLAQFIDRAWTDHVSDLPGTAARVRDAVPRLRESPDQAAAFVQLAEHVLLAHQGEPGAIAGCLEEVEALRPPPAGLHAALDRARLAARLLNGQPQADEGMALALAVRAHGTAACGFAARGDIAGARRTLEAAAARVEQAGDDVEARKAIAASFNNLASQLLDARLEPRTDTRNDEPRDASGDTPRDAPRDAAADELMMDAALHARTAWGQAGTWLHEERAEYLVARCAAAIGDAARAASHARACLLLCESNGADAFEQLFAHEALGRAAHAAGDGGGLHHALARMRSLQDALDDPALRASARDAIDQLAALCAPQ